jgi:hypothetical protein
MLLHQQFYFFKTVKMNGRQNVSILIAERMNASGKSV